MPKQSHANMARIQYWNSNEEVVSYSNDFS